jgi:hypothetical protein
MNVIGLTNKGSVKLIYTPEDASEQKEYLERIKVDKETPKTEFQEYLDQFRADNYYCFDYGTGYYEFRKSTEPQAEFVKKRANGLPRGVYEYGKKWRAATSKKGKSIPLGVFDSMQEASDAYESAILKKKRKRKK